MCCGNLGDSSPQGVDQSFLARFKPEEDPIKIGLKYPECAPVLKSAALEVNCRSLSDPYFRKGD